MKHLNTHETRNILGIRSHGIWSLILVSLVFCQNASAGNVVEGIDVEQDSAKAVVQNTERQIRQWLSDDTNTNKEKQESKLELVEVSVAPNIDFEGITRISVGSHWKNLNKIQKQNLVHEVKDMLIRNYIMVLDSYHDQEVRYLPTQAQSRPHDALVKTEIIGSNGHKEQSIDYRLHNKKGSWKVYDVIADGVSVVLSQKVAFRAIIQVSGVDSLIQQLADKNGADREKLASNI